MLSIPKFIPLFLALATLAACGGGEEPTRVGDAAGVHPEKLADLAAAVQKARADGDPEKLRALVAGMVPTKADLMSLLGDACGMFLEEWSFVDLPADHEMVASLSGAVFQAMDPARTSTVVHTAGVAEILAAANGTPGGEEFPGGMRRFVALVADPSRTFCVVEHVKPGDDRGMKYTCFTRTADGRWIFLPKPWRAIPDPD